MTTCDCHTLKSVGTSALVSLIWTPLRRAGSSTTHAMSVADNWYSRELWCPVGGGLGLGEGKGGADVNSKTINSLLKTTLATKTGPSQP